MEKSSSNNRRLHGYLILAQLAFAGFQILSRIALVDGVDALAFTFYRNCLASLLLGTVSYFMERDRKRPSLWTMLYVFGLGFLGVTINQVCYLTGLKHTSAIFASAMRNSTPVFTFVIAALSKVEKVDLRRREGHLKVLGALLGLCGSLILSLYRGPVIIKSNISIPGTTPLAAADATPQASPRPLHMNWRIGAVYLTISCAAFGGFLILQAPVLDKYPAPISFAAFTCLSSVVQIPFVNLIFRDEWSSWRATSRSEVFAISYAGLIGSGLVSLIQSWGVLIQGPVIVAAYQPLETIFTALFSMIFLKEDLHLGSVVGGVIVITGLYMLILGQQIARRESLLELQQAAATQEEQLDEYPFRKYCSCDLERQHIKYESSEDTPTQRRHSLALGDLRGSYKIQMFLKRSEDNQQLLLKPGHEDSSTNCS